MKEEEGEHPSKRVAREGSWFNCTRPDVSAPAEVYVTHANTAVVYLEMAMGYTRILWAKSVLPVPISDTHTHRSIRRRLGRVVHNVPHVFPIIPGGVGWHTLALVRYNTGADVAYTEPYRVYIDDLPTLCMDWGSVCSR
jgi:hypothetical protein